MSNSGDNGSRGDQPSDVQGQQPADPWAQAPAEPQDPYAQPGETFGGPQAQDPFAQSQADLPSQPARSEERRVGKECRSRWAAAGDTTDTRRAARRTASGDAVATG